MSDIRVYDNFVSEEEFLPIHQYFVDTRTGFNGESVPWYWVDGVNKFGDGRFMFVNLCYGNLQIVNHNMFQVLVPILMKIDPLSLTRIKANLTLKDDTPVDDSHYHTDDKYCDCVEDGGKGEDAAMTTAIYYVNTNNGGTQFKNGEQVDSVANRLVVFPCHMYHAPIGHTDEKNRIVINFNYFHSQTGI